MKRKNIFIILGIVGTLLLLITGIYYLGFAQQNIFHSSHYPIRAVSVVESRGSCNPDSPYDKTLLPYYQKVQVRTIDNQNQADSAEDSNSFIWDIGLRTSSERYSKAEMDGGIPPHIRCDSQKPLCAYTSGCPTTLVRECPRIDNTNWVYNQEKDLCFPEILIYRLENNLCSLKNILSLERQTNDYDTLVECKANIVIPEPPTPQISPLSQFFTNIWDWIKGLFGG